MEIEPEEIAREAVPEAAPERARESAEAGEPRGRGGGRRGRFGRRRACALCVEKKKSVDYKDVGFLRRYVSERGRIESRRRMASCAKHQRIIARAIKRARHLALLPYTAAHVRNLGAAGPR